MKNLINAFKIFKSLRDKETISEVEEQIMNSDFNLDINTELIDKTVNAIVIRIKQMKLKNLEAITLKMESYEYPFPPLVIISNGGENIDIEMEFIKPKELHYELDGISAEYNNTYANNDIIITETYQNIIRKLQQYKWSSVCSLAQEFKIDFAK